MAMAEASFSGKLGPKTPDEVVANFITNVDSIAVNGYQQVCWEPFGLMMRLYNREMEPGIIELLRKDYPEFCLSCHHGIGRASYFAWEFFPPVCAAQIDILIRDANSVEEANNILAGFAWALTLVNVKNPKLVSFLLEDLAIGGRHRDAISNGVISALVVAYQSAPGVGYMDDLGKEAERNDGAMWSLIYQSWKTAKREFQSRSELGQIFRFRQDLV